MLFRSEGYAGCQSTWVRTSGGWRKVVVSYWNRGELRVFWGTDPAGLDQILCRYERGRRIATDSADCPDPARVRRAKLSVVAVLDTSPPTTPASSAPARAPTSL